MVEAAFHYRVAADRGIAFAVERLKTPAFVAMPRPARPEPLDLGPAAAAPPFLLRG